MSFPLPALRRRNWLGVTSSALIGAGVAACGGAGQASTPSDPAFVLVHGAWHNASTYTQVIDQLAGLGLSAVAVDLPGHGLKARFPNSWLRRPFDPNAFATEPSPLAPLTLDDYVAETVRVIDLVRALGHDKVVLVGHSLGGGTITKVAEVASQKIAKLVYLTAFIPFNGKSLLDAAQLAQGAANEVPGLVVADPAVVGAQRIDFNSPDPAYRAKIKSAFYADASDDAFAAMGHLLTPDEPILPALTPISRTQANWGSVPRHYIKCLQDKAVVPALAQAMIDQADAEFPGSKTQVHTMATSHSPFISEPVALARILAAIARA